MPERKLCRSIGARICTGVPDTNCRPDSIMVDCPLVEEVQATIVVNSAGSGLLKEVGRKISSLRRLLVY